MSDFSEAVEDGGEGHSIMPIGPGGLPDVTAIENPEGPLADKFNLVEREKREKQDAIHKAKAEEFLESLIKAGEDETEARLFLGLPVTFTKDNDPRPWVTYYEPPPPDEDLTARIAAVLEAGGGAEAVAAVIAANQGMNPPQMQEAVDSDECELCGAIVGDLDKHMKFAHKDQLLVNNEDLQLERTGIPLPTDTEGKNDESTEQLPTSTGEADSGPSS